MGKNRPNYISLIQNVKPLEGKLIGVMNWGQIKSEEFLYSLKADLDFVEFLATVLEENDATEFVFIGTGFDAKVFSINETTVLKIVKGKTIEKYPEFCVQPLKTYYIEPTMRWKYESLIPRKQKFSIQIVPKLDTKNVTFEHRDIVTQQAEDEGYTRLDYDEEDLENIGLLADGTPKWIDARGFNKKK